MQVSVNNVSAMSTCSMFAYLLSATCIEVGQTDIWMNADGTQHQPFHCVYATSAVALICYIWFVTWHAVTYYSYPLRRLPKVAGCWHNGCLLKRFIPRLIKCTSNAALQHGQWIFAASWQLDRRRRLASNVCTWTKHNLAIVHAWTRSNN